MGRLLVCADCWWKGCAQIKLQDLLAQSKATILSKWFQAALEVYPAESARFFREEKDQFANPVGYMLRQGLEGLYDELLRGMDYGRVYPHLEKVIKIRAVQDLPPSRALAFIFVLKELVGEELAREKGTGFISPVELKELASRFDQLALLAFDLYTQYRERLGELKIQELKGRTVRLLRRANLVD